MELDKILELTISAVTLLFVVLGGSWALARYLEEKKRQYYSAFWTSKLELFLEASRVAATMATTTSPDRFVDARETFLELYYGRLSVVEGQKISDAMQTFKPHIPMDSKSDLKLPYQDLAKHSYALARKFQEELAATWKNPFQELETRQGPASHKPEPPRSYKPEPVGDDSQQK